MSTLSNNPAMRTLGQHAGRIMSIVASNDSRILSIGSDGLVRMWDLGFTEDMIGVSGVMEFPLVAFGISLSYIGTAGVALNGERLCDFEPKRPWRVRPHLEGAYKVQLDQGGEGASWAIDRNWALGVRNRRKLLMCVGSNSP